MRRKTFWIWKKWNKQDFWSNVGAPVLGNDVDWYSDASSRNTVRKIYWIRKYEKKIFSDPKNEIYDFCAKYVGACDGLVYRMVVMRGVSKNLMTIFFGSGNMRRKNFRIRKKRDLYLWDKMFRRLWWYSIPNGFLMRGR
jgi:hypothetical protein